MDPLEFGKYIKTLREERGMTLTELSSLSGTSHPYLSQIENGRKGIPSTKVLKKISEPLGIPYMELMYRAGHVESPPAAVDFLTEEIEKVMIWLPNLKKDHTSVLEDLEAEYRSKLGENFKITSTSLKDLVWEDSLKEGVTDLVHKLSNYIEQIKEKGETPLFGHDLKSVLESKNKVFYNNHPLTNQDRERILSMLSILFPEYAKRPKQ